jgi:hypothetical protein
MRHLAKLQMRRATALTILGLAAFVSPPADAQGRICSSTITPQIQSVLLQTFMEGGLRDVSLNCHDFRLRSPTEFDLASRDYLVRGRLSHVVSLNPDEQWHFFIRISEDGRRWQLAEILDLRLSQIVPLPQRGGWEREAERLINEFGRIAAARVKTNYDACFSRLSGDGPRDHRAGAELDTASCRLDFPATGAPIRDHRSPSPRDHRS